MEKLILFFLAFSIDALNVSQLEKHRNLNIQVPQYPPTTKHIAQTNLSTSATNLYTIQQSGRYYFDTPLQGLPGSANCRVIKITASNVTLDLNGMTISQAHTNNQTGLNAIDIASSVSNVIIMNGFINGITDVGINIGSSCNNIRILNIGISNCKGGGIQVATTCNGISLQNVDVTNCVGGGTSALPSNAATGLYMTTCTDFELKDCNFCFNQEAAGSGNGYGAYLLTCQDGRINNCNFSSNKGQASVGLQLITNCRGIELENCKFNNNQSSAGNVYGLSIDTCQALNFTNCSALYNQDTGGTDCTGIYLTNTDACVLTNCESNNNIGASGDTVEGFYVNTGTANIFKACKALYNQTTAANAYGFRFVSATGCTICNSESSKNKATTTGNAYGIYVHSNSTNNNVLNNFLFSNVANGDSGNRYYGFYDATLAATGTSTFLGGNVSYGHGQVGVSTSTQPNSGTSDANLNYYFELAGTLDSSNSSASVITEVQRGGTGLAGRIVTSGNTGMFGTFDNLSVY